ncbi:MAG: HI0074 family nucleotidyltransferase substrate-binding subunit [Thermodesulfobacteriota bacterium]|nr:HI0074 family nucleotidyltransferase substrate-binding subunit [Thermodesulfobacteriota bacterium]
MERVRQKVYTAQRALKTLQELLDKGSPSIVERDAAIQRFEYTFEAVWKAGKLFLREVEGLEIGSPKGVIRSFLQVGLLTEEQTALGLSMVDDRNLTSHTYNESLADQIYSQLNTYSDLMAKCVLSMKKALNQLNQ